MAKVLLTATVQSHIAQFHKPLINMLKSEGHEVFVGARYNLNEKASLTLTEPDGIFEIPFSRSPFNIPKLFKAYKVLKKVINEENFDIVHCNTPVAGILTRLACKKLRKQGKIKVIYESHGYQFFKGGSKIDWILWYPIEKFFSRYADTLILINNPDYNLSVRKKFKAKRIRRVHGVGLNISQFIPDTDCGDLKKELGFSPENKICFSIGEINKNKNHETIIRAIAKINDKNIHYMIAGNGPLLESHKALAKDLGIENNIHFLGYRRDIPALCMISDIAIFPSKREGLGMAPLEQQYFGLPLITSDLDVFDYSTDGVTGYRCDATDVDMFADRIKNLIYDEEKKKLFGENGKKAAKNYSLEQSLSEMKEYYNELLS